MLAHLEAISSALQGMDVVGIVLMITPATLKVMTL